MRSTTAWKRNDERIALPSEKQLYMPGERHYTDLNEQSNKLQFLKINGFFEVVPSEDADNPAHRTIKKQKSRPRASACFHCTTSAAKSK